MDGKQSIGCAYNCRYYCFFFGIEVEVHFFLPENIGSIGWDGMGWMDGGQGKIIFFFFLVVDS